jgi:plastocyanin
MSDQTNVPNIDQAAADELTKRVVAGNGEVTTKDRAWRDWMMVSVGLTAVLSVLGVILAVVALSSTTASTKTVIQQAAPTHAAVTPTAPSQDVSLVVKADSEHARRGPDGQWHDAFLPADFSVKPGGTVTVTISNYDSGPHSFTAPSMNINEIIPGGGTPSNPRVVSFKFTAPSKAGKYQWFCAVPCDPWAMAHDGYMRGFVTVTA